MKLQNIEFPQKIITLEPKPISDTSNVIQFIRADEFVTTKIMIPSEIHAVILEF
ncbi:predicted protein [Botrytis cinerea T4]|uniref:Uncharacterized protein n=1 Tax=Botryotinia fuckeliana (strain T4) TaxID=999810 RepID=G2YNV1_BOTF4|nr:predicted protein [Botrytis cinerea T4]